MLITETNKFSDILKYADEETLVLLDVDNTLIEPISYVGGVAWFDYMMAKMKKRGIPEEDVIHKTSFLWVRLQQFVKVRTVEEAIPSVIKTLHKKNIKTMGLTARSFLVSRITDQQLKSVDISLQDNTICGKEIIFTDHAGFYNGVLSIEPFGSKGERLLQFLKKIDYETKKVLFVDDLSSFVEDVGTTLSETSLSKGKKIHFKGIRYGGADDQEIRFNPARADEELLMVFRGTEHESLVKSFMEGDTFL